MSTKRKRDASSAGSGLAAAKRFLRGQRSLAPQLRGRVSKGYTRRSGFYGRFPPSGDETKFFDTALSFLIDATAEASSTAATGLINLIPQGVTEATRVGRKCVVKSVSIRGVVTNIPAAAATTGVAVAMFLVLDKQANGAAPAFSDIFVGTVAMNAHHNLANSGRFVILKKWIMIFNSGGGATTAYDNVVRPWQFFKKCNIPLEFSSTAGAITELRSNNLLLAYGSSNGDDTPNVSANARIRFTDQ